MSRFYVAMMLFDLFKNKSFYDVANFWSQPRGTIQNLYSQVASFATSILYFSKVSPSRIPILLIDALSADLRRTLALPSTV